MVNSNSTCCRRTNQTPGNAYLKITPFAFNIAECSRVTGAFTGDGALDPAILVNTVHPGRCTVSNGTSPGEDADLGLATTCGSAATVCSGRSVVIGVKSNIDVRIPIVVGTVGLDLFSSNLVVEVKIGSI